jgi:hypothetical protein
MELDKIIQNELYNYLKNNDLLHYADDEGIEKVGDFIKRTMVIHTLALTPKVVMKMMLEEEEETDGLS